MRAWKRRVRAPSGSSIMPATAVQLSGRNYLIPTTAHIEREGDVEIEAVSADWVIEQMRYARNRLNIVILDACRNNPFSRSMRSVDHGLATMDAPGGNPDRVFDRAGRRGRRRHRPQQPLHRSIDSRHARTA